MTKSKIISLLNYQSLGQQVMKNG